MTRYVSSTPRAFLSRYWRKTEFEGFWGAILEKEAAFSDRYRDWEEEM
ncbi:MAG: hypothetical protein ACYC5N_11930 [Endomicrobiales bacterium]